MSFAENLIDNLANNLKKLIVLAYIIILIVGIVGGGSLLGAQSEGMTPVVIGAGIGMFAAGLLGSIIFGPLAVLIKTFDVLERISSQIESGVQASNRSTAE